MKYKTKGATSKLRALYYEDESDADMEGGGFFQQMLKSAFMGVSDLIVRPWGFDASKVKEGWLRRPIDMPPLEDLSKMVASTYDPPSEGGIDSTPIQGYTLIAKTPTVSFFQVDKKKNIIIIALRGTSFSDVGDITADLGIVKGIVSDASTARNVRNSERYRRDVLYIKEIKPMITGYLGVKDPLYYAVGHSLSGAMIDELLEDDLVSSAVSFNPAIERRNFNIPNNNHRVYLECDILYNLLGKFITNGNVEVVAKANPAGPDAGPIDTTKGTLKCHNIKEVIPMMSGKGINNNVSQIYKDNMANEDCEAILGEMTTMDVGPNSGKERQRRRYEECRRKQGLPAQRDPFELPSFTSFQDLINRPSRPTFRPIGRGPLGDLWRMGKKELGIKKEDGTFDEGPDLSKPYVPVDFTDRGAVEDIFYGKPVEDAPSKFNQRGSMRLFGRGGGAGRSFSNRELTKIILDKNKVIADLEAKAYGGVGGGIFDGLGTRAFDFLTENPETRERKEAKRRACEKCNDGRMSFFDFDGSEKEAKRKACKKCNDPTPIY